MARTAFCSASLLALVGMLLAFASPAQAHGILVGTPSAGGEGPAPRGPVQLQGHTVRATIDDRTAEVTVEQVFRNTTDAELEGTYLFPLPEGAVVSRFAMTMAGQMVEGEVLEAAQAKRSTRTSFGAAGIPASSSTSAVACTARGSFPSRPRAK